MVELFFSLLGMAFGLAIAFKISNAAWLLGTVIVCGVAAAILRRWVIKKAGEIDGQ